MSITHTITVQWEQGNNSLSLQDTFTGEAEANVSVSVPDSSTDFEITLGIDVSEIKSIVISSNQVITLETNDGTTPDDTFAITANNPLIWNVDSPAANPFSADITALFVTNASGSAATFNVRCIVDATP